MTLVEAPVALNRDPVAVSGVQRQVGRHDGAAKHRGEELLGEDTSLLEELTTVGRLGAALLRQRDVNPPGEEVLCVPFALAVAEQHKGVCHSPILPVLGSQEPGPGSGARVRHQPQGLGGVRPQAGEPRPPEPSLATARSQALACS